MKMLINEIGGKLFKLLHFLRKNNTVLIGSSIIGFGSVVGYLCVFLCAPFLSRLYTPQQFGYYSIAFSLLTIAVTIISGKYEAAIVVGKTDKEMDWLTQLSIILVIIVSACLLLFVFFTDMLASWFHMHICKLDKSYLLIIFGVLVLGIYQVFYNIALRYKRYKVLALCEIVTKCGQVILGLLFGIFFLANSGLLFAYILSLCIAVFVIVKTVSMRSLLSYKKFNFPQLCKVAKEYCSFPRFIALGFLVNVLTWQLPVIFIGGLYNAHEAGLFGMLIRVFGAPCFLVGQLVSNVYFTHIAARLRENNNKKSWLMDIFLNTFIKLIVLIVPMFVLIVLIGPKILLLVFDKTWSGIVIYLPILSLMYFFKILAMPFGSLLVTLDKHMWLFSRELILLILTLLIFGIGMVKKLSMMEVILYYSIISSMYYILYIFLSWFAIRQYMKNGV